MEEVIISMLGPDPRNEAVCQPGLYIFALEIARFKFPLNCGFQICCEQSNSCQRPARDSQGKSVYFWFFLVLKCTHCARE